MRRSRTPIAAAVGAAAVLVLAGCGGGGAQADPEPIIPSSSSADPSPTDPSESGGAGEAPVMPEAAKERSAEGVEAFVQYWGDVLTHAYESGDPTTLAEISSDGCQSCSATVDLIDDVYESGGTMESAGWTSKQVAFGPDLQRPLATFDRGLEVTRRSGEPPERHPAAENTIEFDLRWRDGGWIVNEFALKA